MHLYCRVLMILLVFAPRIALAAADQCRPQLEAELLQQGVEWSTLREAEWEEETKVTGPGSEAVSGYQFYARPESCASGRLVARMDVDCRITQIFTRRGCKVGTVRAK